MSFVMAPSIWLLLASIVDYMQRNSVLLPKYDHFLWYYRNWMRCLHLAQNALKFADFNVKFREFSGAMPTAPHSDCEDVAYVAQPIRGRRGLK